MQKRVALKTKTTAKKKTQPRSKKQSGPVTRKRAQRLDPAVRRELILDSAAKLLVERGISNCTLEAVGTAAHVSKALVYRYFETREALFGALLTREFDFILGRNFTLVPPGTGFKAGLKVHVRRYLEYIAERGALMRALTHDASVIGQIEAQTKFERREVLDFWTEQIVKTYDVPEDIARLGSIMVIAAEEAAEASLRRGKVSIERVTDFWTTFILGGWAAYTKNLKR